MPRVNGIPESAAELLERLFTIFPQFRASYSGPFHDDEPSFHSVLLGFVSDFSGQLAHAPEDQLRAFGALISDAVAQPGGNRSLENAFWTCLLEHLRSIRAERALRPYLSKRARELTKA